MGLDHPDDSDEVQGPNYLTTAQCGGRLGTSPDFVVGEIRDGRLAALVIERPGLRTVYRITEAALKTYMTKYRWTPPPAA
jgi:hypothetical protein